MLQEMYGANTPRKEEQSVQHDRTIPSIYGGNNVDPASQSDVKGSIADIWKKKKRQPTLEEVVFDSSANVLRKRSQQLIQNDIAF